MNEKFVIHFGAGALGRGLVVPMLYESNCTIVLADTNQELIEYIKERKGYTLDISDDKKNRKRRIPIHDIVSPGKDEERLIAYLQQCNTVTTSVRRENLIHVARVICKAWAMEDNSNKRIFCCENIEGVGQYFNDLLAQCTDDDEVRKNLSQIKVPDTIVDRICAVNEESQEVISETFHECSVDSVVVRDTGMEYIPAIDDIKAHFYRKRYLLNTYADTLAFIGQGRGLHYVYETAQDAVINKEIEPYILLLKQLLHEKYKLSMEEIQDWADLYRLRLSNMQIPRSLETVARGFWSKMSLTERFMCPLVELYERGIHIEEGMKTIHTIVKEANKLEHLSKQAIIDKLEVLWCHDAIGKQLFELYIKQDEE